MARKPIEVAVLNSIQAAAADLSLVGGKLGCTDLGQTIKLVDGVSVTKTAYAAGTLSVKTVEFAAAVLTAQTGYRLAIEVPDAKDFSGGGREANQLIPIREYTVFFDAAPTAAALAAAFRDKINADLGRKVNASLAGTLLTLTLIKLTEGDFFTDSPTGCVDAVVTPFVAPAGTPAIVEALAPTKSSATANYTTWKITFNKLYKNNAVSGGQVFFENDILIFADELEADFAAFETELDAILDGTHVPVADYLGI